MGKKWIVSSCVITCVGLSGCMKMSADITIDSKGMAQSVIVQDMSAFSAMGSSFGGQSSTDSGKNAYDCVQAWKKQYSSEGSKDDATGGMVGFSCEDVGTGVTRISGYRDLTKSGALVFSGGFAYYYPSANNESSTGKTMSAQEIAFLESMVSGSGKIRMPGEITQYPFGKLADKETLTFSITDMLRSAGHDPIVSKVSTGTFSTGTIAAAEAAAMEKAKEIRSQVDFDARVLTKKQVAQVARLTQKLSDARLEKAISKLEKAISADSFSPTSRSGKTLLDLLDLAQMEQDRRANAE